MTHTLTANPLPTYLELIPEELAVRVYRNSIEAGAGRVPTWTFVSDGLRRFGQKEVVFILRRAGGDGDFPGDPLDFFLLLHQQATDGRFVEAGGYSRFARPDGFLGQSGPVGMTYVPAPSLKGVNYPDRALAAILTTDDEIDAVRAHGNYRLLSLLGFRADVFPYPSWSDPGRGSVLNGNDVKQSLLGRIALATVPGLMIRRQRNQIHLHMLESAWPVLEKRLVQLPPAGPLALLTDPDPEAKAWLVWKPGMPVETIASDNRPGVSLTGGFVAFIVGPRVEEGAHVCEDGIAVRLRPATWDKVRDALLNAESMVVPAQNGMRFILGLDTAIAPAAHAGGHYFQKSPVLMERVQSDARLEFEQDILDAVGDHFAELKPGNGQALTVVCVIRPGRRAKFWLDARPIDLPSASRNSLSRRLCAIAVPTVRAPVAWAVKFDLWGGTGNANHFAHMPAEWTAAIGPNESPQIPDDILPRVWPDAAG